MFIADYMTADPLTITADVLVPEARRLLDDNHFRHLPVVDDEKKLIGVVTDRDLRSAYPSTAIDDETYRKIFAAVAATMVLTLMIGSLTVFQIVALTLVVGIGVDYALFLDPAATRQEKVLAARSVSLCAGSTLLAFVTMAWSDVRVMGEIGLTVSLGVLVVIVLSMGMMGRQDGPKSTETGN